MPGIGKAVIRTVVRWFDSSVGAVIAVIFLSAVGLLCLFRLFGREKKDYPGGITELYMSIIDPRQSGIPTQEKDMLLDGFKRRILCYHFDFDRDRDEEGSFGKDIRLGIISVHPGNFLTKAGLRRTAASLVEVRTFFGMLAASARDGVNVIRAQDPHLLGINAYLLSRLIKVPFIVQVCSNYEIKDRQARGLTFRPFVFKTVERCFERAIMRACDLVLTDREHYRDFGLIPGDIPEERYGNMGFFVSDVHYAPPSSRRDLRGDLNIPLEKKVILYVGRLAEVKYPLDLVKMFAACLRKRSDLVLVIAGDGILRDRMSDMARQGGFSGSVIFLQKVPQARLADLYNTADAVCFTSAGFTMVEAALAEKCIVAYDFEWHAEFIGADERGILVPFGDTDRFASELLRALGDPDLRRQLGKAAREYALDNYSRDAAIKKETQFYKSVFDRRGYKLEKAV